MSELARTSVPKFGSFKPKSSQAIPDKNHDEKEKRRIEEKLHDHSRDREHGKHRHYSSTTKERRNERIVKEDHSRDREEPLDIFVVDRKGDEKNLAYGSIHRYDVPLFHRTGSGHILGASSDTKIDRDHGDERGIVLNSWRDRKSGSREKYIFSKLEMQRPRLLRLRPGSLAQESDNRERDYIPLGTIRGDKRRRIGDVGERQSGSDSDGVNYRSIHGKAKTKDDPLDDNLEFVSNSDSGSDAGSSIKIDASIKQRGVEISRRVDQFPQEIQAWLSLIEHQDVLLRGTDDRRRITNAEIQSTAEIKIHMYEKALEKVVSVGDRETLLLGLMLEGSKIWEIKTQSDRWQQISKDNIRSLVLWKSYLDFKQSSFSTFRYEEVKDIFLSRIKLLCGVIISTPVEQHNTLFEQLIYVLLRYTIFVRESGFCELAIAIWQGLLELNFCAPSRPLAKNEITESFKEFWESEVPRIGEDGSLGWRHFAKNAEDSTIPDAQTDVAAPVLSRDLELFKSWAAAERSIIKSSRLPARTMDEVMEDDPYRVILISDIEDLTICVPNSGNLHKLLLDAFLIFCRLPPIPGAQDEASRDWWNDSFVRGELLEFSQAWIKEKFLLGNRDSDDSQTLDITSILSNCSGNFTHSTESMFAGLWFKNLELWQNVYPDDSGPVPYHWIRLTLKQLTEASFREDLAEYYLAFEWRNEPSNIKKISKNILKQHPSSLRLYNAYALIEQSRGNHDIAQSVFSAALQMDLSASSNDSIILWKSLVWTHLEVNNRTLALQTLLSIPIGIPDPSITSNPTTLLKAKQHFTSTRDFLLSSSNPNQGIIYNELLALLTYLTSTSTTEPQSSHQGDISSSLSIFTTFSTLLSTRPFSSFAQEQHLQSATRLLFIHLKHGPYRPVFIRNLLTTFLTTFPRNSIFLALFIWNESRFRVENRVRNIFLNTILTPQNESLTSHLAAIKFEMQSGTVHSVRAAFERAVSSPVGKGAGGLWKVYILWLSTISRGTFGSQHSGKGIKEVWMRGIRAVPWIKEMYLLGFETLDRVGDDELKSVYRVLGEKELRVHIDLEERLENME
ncbi:hypothetical protein B7494_g2640 [Chlorociboria aeruginascens]|nr:hypothetical protein B7494_g2640 [Chlorociboria aeruginascens]